jgi:hypothetical protein
VEAVTQVNSDRKDIFGGIYFVTRAGSPAQDVICYFGLIFLFYRF